MAGERYLEVPVEVEEERGYGDGGVAECEAHVGVCVGLGEAQGFGEGGAGGCEEVGACEVDGEVVVEGVFEVCMGEFSFAVKEVW